MAKLDGKVALITGMLLVLEKELLQLTQNTEQNW